ncbi:MAG: hypothetical protein NTV22_10935, partial [bacterium]|nr:hypothetical protein [bacterium]
MMNFQYPTLNKNKLRQFILHKMILRQNHFSLNPESRLCRTPSSPEPGASVPRTRYRGVFYSR